MWISIAFLTGLALAATGKLYVGTDIYKYRQAWFGLLVRR